MEKNFEKIITVDHHNNMLENLLYRRLYVLPMANLFLNRAPIPKLLCFLVMGNFFQAISIKSAQISHWYGRHVSKV